MNFHYTTHAMDMEGVEVLYFPNHAMDKEVWKAWKYYSALHTPWIWKYGRHGSTIVHYTRHGYGSMECFEYYNALQMPLKWKYGSVEYYNALQTV